MADFLSVYTDAGKAKRAADFRAGLNTPIVSVEYGTGNRTPDGTETGLVSPYNPPITFANPGGVVVENTVTITNNIPESFRAPNDIPIHEAAYKTTDGTVIFYASVPSGAMFTKPGNTGLIVPFYMAFEAGDVTDLSGVTFSVLPIPIGDEETEGIVRYANLTEAQATTGHVSNRVLSVLRGWQQITVWWNNTTISASKITSGVLNILRLPVAGTSVLDAGTSTTSVATVAGIVRMIRRFVPKATEAQYKARSSSSVFVTPDSIPAPDIRTFTSSGTWTKPDGAVFVFVKIWGGGGSGNTRGQTTAIGGGGGGYQEIGLLPSDLPATVPIIVGAGGVAPSGIGRGRDGGNSGFGGAINGIGGRGGEGDTGQRNNAGDGGIPNGGDGVYDLAPGGGGGGAAGPVGNDATVSASNSEVSMGGVGLLGGGSGGNGNGDARVPGGPIAATDGEAPGGGGGGVFGGSVATGTDRGGSGGDGRVIVMTYF